MSWQPTISTLSNTIQSFLKDEACFNIANKPQFATLLCSASIASTIGYRLYTKLMQNGYEYISGSYPYDYNLKPFNYNHYKPILSASAPGKIILCGEHAVVYGVTSLSSAINKRTTITIYEPIDIHRVINLRTQPLHDNQSPIHSTLALKLDCVCLEWKVSDLIAVHNLNPNKWEYKLIQNQYHLLKPMISLTQNIDMTYIDNHPLYSQHDWHKQVTSVLLLLLFQCFSKLFSDQIFISYGIVIDVRSDLPIGAGLGSSAAFSTALSAVLYYYWVYVTAGIRKNKITSLGVQTTSRICKLAYESEKIYHGTHCSGIDHITSVYGGYIKYKNKEHFSALDVEHKVPLLVIDTNVVGDTKKLVHGVKHLYNKHPAVINAIFQSIEQIGENMVNVLGDKDIAPHKLYKNINALFAMNHGLLLSLGVGHNAINDIQNICTQYGFGKGFKITGAGGGGSVIVSLLNKRNFKQKVETELICRLRGNLSSKGYRSYFIETGEDGMSCKFY